MSEIEPLIACPSAGRAGNVKVFRLLPDIPLCVPAAEEAAYRQAYPDAELVAHPDDVLGIASKRQWMLDNMSENLFMLDDDITSLIDMGAPAGETSTITDPEVIRDLIYRLFDQMVQMGGYLCGFENFALPDASRPQQPFVLTGFISGIAIGVSAREGSHLFFPDSIMAADLFVSAANAHFHRFVLRDQRYCFTAPGTWTNKGGATQYRTVSRMKTNKDVLVSYFGEAIDVKTGTPRATIKNNQQLVLKVPW